MSAIWQIKKIHALKSLLNMDENDYRKYLASFDVCSSKLLTEAEANILISVLKSQVYIKNSQKYDELIGRDEKMATPAQLRKMEAIWSEIQNVKSPRKSKKTTLKKFLLNHFHIYDIKFLTKVKASKIIPILEKILLSRLEKVILKAI